MENIKINISFTNTSKDLWTFRRFIYSKTWWRYILAALNLTLLLLLIISPATLNNSSKFLIFFIISFVGVHILKLVLWLILGVEKKFFLEKKLSFEKEKVILNFGFEKLETNWSYFDKMEQNKDYIFLYISKLRVIIIPKTTFQSKLETFFQLTKENSLI